MDTLVLIDKLEYMVRRARPVHLTEQVRVDKNEVLDILDQMRLTLPRELKQARRIVEERAQASVDAQREGEGVGDQPPGEPKQASDSAIGGRDDANGEATIDVDPFANRHPRRGSRRLRLFAR